MRVAHKTIFETIEFELGATLQELAEANTVVTTGKRINSVSDDPVGLTQLLDIGSNISNLDQIERNISTGKAWLNNGETALSSLKDLLSEAMVLSEQMANGTYNEYQRETSAKRVDGILRQAINYGNTTVNGQYIFGGTKTETMPFDLDDEDNPTKATYSGNENEFSIKTGADSSVAVGQNGKEVFGYSTLEITSKNNKIQFIEYTNGTASSEITAVIPNGIYTHDELATAMRNAMDIASSESGNSVNYDVDYDATTQKYSIHDNGARPSIHAKLLWATGSNSGESIAPYIGFDTADVRDAIVSDTSVGTFPVDIDAALYNNNTIVISEDDGSGATKLTLTLTDGNYTASELADELETQMDTQSTASGYGIDYEVSYDATNQQFIIEEAVGTNLQELTIINSDSDATALSALGLTETDHTYTPVESDNEANWNIFSTLLDTQKHLEANDQDGIARSMIILKTHFERIVGTISNIGSNEIRLDIRSSVLTETKLSYTERGASIEDADLIEAVSNLKLKEFAYEASLAASARVMKLSLADYI